MAPKKAKTTTKKAKDVAVEPEHDPAWERAVISGVWSKALNLLPDADTWPTWGALRERLLSSCREVRVRSSPTVGDAFVSELVRLAPPRLVALDLHGSIHLHKVVISPLGCLPSLESLDASACTRLEYVLVQSATLTRVTLAGCSSLHKVLLHCPKVTEVDLSGCPALEAVYVWSEALTHLDLVATGAPELATLELQCPQLADVQLPPLAKAPVAVKPAHPPIAAMLRDRCREAAELAAKA